MTDTTSTRALNLFLSLTLNNILKKKMKTPLFRTMQFYIPITVYTDALETHINILNNFLKCIFCNSALKLWTSA